METENKSLPAAAYVACGVAVGAVLGLLFAPKKGSELRSDIDEFGHAAARKGRKLIAEAKGVIPASREALHEVREKMESALKS